VVFVTVRNELGQTIAQAGEVHHDLHIHETLFRDSRLTVQEVGHEPGGLYHASGHTFLLTSKISLGARSLGTVQLAVNTASANHRLEDISLWGFKMVLVVIAFGGALLILVGRRVKRNIRYLIQITRRMAAGDLSQRVNIQSGDEVQQLGESFNLMAEAIKANEAQLEHLVELRTSQLENEKKKLELILNNVPNAFLVLDKSLKVESVSSQFESVLNSRREEILGKQCALSELLHESVEACPSRKALRTGRVQATQAAIVGPSGEEKFLEHVAIPILRNGKTEKVLEVVTDVTARKRFEERLVRSEKLSATGEMAAIIAHEMRNSLSSVNLILQCLTDSECRSDSEVESIDVAIQAVNRMETIVRQLLEFARPSEPALSLEDVNALVRQSLAFCKYQFERKQIVVLKNLADGLPLCQLDGELIRQALINLLLNAKDSVGQKGTISVATSQETLVRTLQETYENKTVELRPGQSVLKVSVRDDGEGIDADNLKRIFDPFFTSKTNGTGLGLATAKRAVTEHGGVLQVASKPGAGSVFIIVLPVEPSPEGPAFAARQHELETPRQV